MIKQIFEKPSIKAEDIFFGKILCLINAYGFEYGFATFYQLDNTAYISRLDGDFVLASNTCLSPNQLEELTIFLSIQGYNSILINEKNGEGLNSFLKGKLFFNNIYEFAGEASDEIPPQKATSFEDIYRILSEAFDSHRKENFESWYLDFSHRTRHGVSRIFTIDYKTTATVQFSIDNLTFLGQIATLKNQQNKGLCKKLLLQICHEYKGTKIQLICENQLAEFYEKTGFKFLEKACTITR